MCSNPLSPYLVGLSKTGEKAIVYQADCDDWECEECAKRKQNQWVARAIIGCKQITSNGTGLSFVTVTSHKSLKDFAATAAVFPHAWSLLYARMKRFQTKFDYLMVIELHKKGKRLHAHLLTDFTARQRWWKDNNAYSGLGYQAKVRTVENEGSAAGYVSKYLAKSLEGAMFPPKFRRIRVTNNWAELPTLHEPSNAYNWLVCHTTTSLWAAVEECQEKRLSMVDMRTGEYFDYQDACDTWYQ